MANTSISLGDHFDCFIKEKVATGSYSTASEVVREGLRLLEEKDAKLAALRAYIQEGINSGPSVEFDIDAFLSKQL